MALSGGWSTEAGAEVIFNDPSLPPESNPPDCDALISLYYADGLFASYPGPYTISDPQHKCFQNVFRQAVGPDELEDFDSILEAKIDLGPGPVSATLIGPVQVRVYNKVGNTTGLFDTEMVSLSLSGDVGGINVMLRESPTLASLGQTDIVDLGGGLYHIDSFFDVFTELSIDGGETWLAQLNEPVRITLVPIATPVDPTTWGTIKALYK
jgi:hypothetical protein